ncbi:MAG: aminotransferase class V-fold PLP-dependent enzyme [Planctomycetes bacterium]|nr:aminotransferase class V-fold PLP-dependent enzyme [Planctomycetota bacterium]
MRAPVYLDNHATTRVDPRVVDAMVPCFVDLFGNPGSTSHRFGHAAKRAVDESRARIAAVIGASDREIVFTSGATESNNLAIRGVAERSRAADRHLISIATEHKSVLDPLRRLARKGCSITILPVARGDDRTGRIEPERIAESIGNETRLVSVMLANNEIGTIQPIREIGRICRERGVLLHCDATQAVGKLAVRVDELDVDLMSFTAHKIYGPKGVGALYVRRAEGRVRLEPQIDGGGQEGGLRSGTLNVPGIVGFAKAIDLCEEERAHEAPRLAALRDTLYDRLVREIPGVSLNGPPLDQADRRLAGNLSCSFAGVDGEALMIAMGDLAVSSGSACTSANPEPSHVLRALGLDDDLVRASLRFGIGRFNTLEEIDFAARTIRDAVIRLRGLRDSS